MTSISPRLTTPADHSTATRRLVVTWQIDVEGDEAASPRAAAESALATQRRASSISTVFEVTNPVTGVTVDVDLDYDEDMPRQAQWLHVATATEIRENHIGGDEASPQAAELEAHEVTLTHITRAMIDRRLTISRAIDSMLDLREDDRWALLDGTVQDICGDAIHLAAAERQELAAQAG